MNFQYHSSASGSFGEKLNQNTLVISSVSDVIKVMDGAKNKMLLRSQDLLWDV